MMVNGKMTHIMEKVQNNGITIRSFTKETLFMDLKQDVVNLSLMEIFTKVTSLTDNSMEKENTTLLKQERFMKVIFMRIKFMEVG